MITKAAAVVAKIVNIFALGTITPIEIGVTVTAVAASAISTVSSTVELSTKTLIFGNKLQSITEMGSEVVHLKQLLDETENYVSERLSTSESQPTGQILDVQTPDVVTDGVGGTQTGTVTLKNTGLNPAWATVHVHILGPKASSGSKIIVYFTAAPPEGTEISGGIQQTISFDYSVLDLRHAYQCLQYEAEVYVSFNGELIGPTVRFFNAGASGVCSTETILDGEIIAGQTKSTMIEIGQGASGAEVGLHYSGSDLDLHIYDEQGKHVGINYNTGEVENDILGATYSGSAASPEWVRLPVSVGERFQVVVAGIATFGSESFELTLSEFQMKNPTVQTSVDFDPTRLNLGSGPKWLRSSIEIKEEYNSAGYSVNDIGVSSILLNGTVPIDPAGSLPIIGDYDNDLIPDLTVYFNRTMIAKFISDKGIKYGNITLLLTGNMNDGTSLEGSNIILISSFGDLNFDGKVDGKDLGLVAKFFDSAPPSPRFEPLADLSHDDRIDGRDLALLVKKLAKTYS